jgi:hypothetical protein
MNACRVGFLAAFSLATLVGAGGIAAAQQATPANIPDLSGGWLRVDSGSGSFDGTAQKVAPAELTAAGKAMVVRGDGRNVITKEMLASTKPNEAGQPYVVLSGGCTAEGTGGSSLSPNSTAQFIVQSKDQVLMVREGPGSRRFHMDGRPHPDIARMTPSMYGHSTGRYEGNALIVETVGLTEGTVQGGGRRRPETRLIERFDLSPDGKRLTLTYTWDDPVLYVRPHTYQLVFERLPEDAYAFETWCDSSDPLQKYSIVPPKQQ